MRQAFLVAKARSLTKQSSVKFPQSALKTALVLAVTNAALVLQGANFQYTFTGSEFTGTFNGVPFAKATLTFSGVADSSGVVFLPSFPGSPIYFLPLTPSVGIDDGVNSYSATLSDDPSYAGWGLIAADLGGGSQFVGFGLLNDLVSPTTATVQVFLLPPGPLYDLASPVLLVTGFLGSSDSINTSGGLVLITHNSSVTGSFSATAVPEVSTFLPVGFALLGGGILVARRRQTQALRVG
jgi:hypothetical protein